MFKTLYLPLILVAAVAVFVGFLVSNPSKVFVPKGSPTPQADVYSTKKVKVKDLVLYLKVADTDEKRAKGLGGVKRLNWYEGMLFVFPEKDVQATFWMKDMVIPIDIIWVNDNKIVKIDRNVQPEPNKTDDQLKKYSPKVPVDYVIEMSAGFCDSNKITVGQSLSDL